MSKLKQYVKGESGRAAARRRLAVDSTYALPGAALAAHARRAAVAAAAKSKHRASEWEIDSLAQMIAASAIGATATASYRTAPDGTRRLLATAESRGHKVAPTWPGKRTAAKRERDVLAWIDYAESRPLGARACEERTLTRGAGTAALLAQRATERLADSRDWRDVASGYRTRSGAEVPTVPDDALSDRPSGDHLADSLPPADVPESDRELAAAVAARLGGTEREQRAMTIALRANLPEPDGQPLNLVTLAAELGQERGTVRNLASDGARLLRAHVPSGAELAELVRDTAERERLAPPSRALRALLTGQPQPLYPSALAAAWAVERLRPSYCPSGARSMPEREPRTERSEQPEPSAEQPSSGRGMGHPVPGVRHVPEQRSAEQDTVSESEADAAWDRANAPMRCRCSACR